MLIAVCCTWALLVASSYAQEEPPFDYSGYEILKIDVENEAQAYFLKDIGDYLKLNFWNDPAHFVGYVLLQVPPELITAVKDILKFNGFNYTTAIQDYQRAIDKEREENNQQHHGHKRAVSDTNYAVYRTLYQVNQFLKQVEQEHPNLAKVFNMGKTFEGRDILGIRITASAPGTKPVVFLECGIHAREWVTVASAVYFIGQLTANSANPSIATLVNNFEWHIIPSANPDGYEYTHTKNRSWRKTRSRSRVQPTCYGADPNRNLDAAFCTVGASKTPCSDTYCGDYAFSEKETQALRDYVTGLGSRIKYYFSIHSFSQLWMYPYGYTSALPSNAAQLRDVSTKGVAALNKKYGTLYKLGPIATAIYPASGSTVDWVYDKIGVKLAFALELRDRGFYGFMLPANQIVPTAIETLEGIRAAILSA